MPEVVIPSPVWAAPGRRILGAPAAVPPLDPLNVSAAALVLLFAPAAAAVAVLSRRVFIAHHIALQKKDCL